jgi:hypothetical protein
MLEELELLLVLETLESEDTELMGVGLLVLLPPDPPPHAERMRTVANTKIFFIFISQAIAIYCYRMSFWRWFRRRWRSVYELYKR